MTAAQKKEMQAQAQNLTQLTNIIEWDAIPGNSDLFTLYREMDNAIARFRTALNATPTELGEIKY